MTSNRYNGIFKKVLISAVAVAAMGSAYADQFEFTSFYNGTATTPGVDVILDTASFDSVLNGWAITGIEANPLNFQLITTGPVALRGIDNTNFIFNTVNGPSITGGTGTLFLEQDPGLAPHANLMWEFFQQNPATASYLIGPAGGAHSSVMTLAPVPEPESYAMLLIGLGLMGASMKRRKDKRA